MMSVDVEVGIAEATIIDPFEGKESPVLRQLRQQLDTTKRRLADERGPRMRQEAELRELRQTASAETSERRAVQREAFINLMTALRMFSPFAPITENTLARVLPNGFTVETLNEAFGVTLENMQAHIDLFFKEQRHAELVNSKYSTGFTEKKSAELMAIEASLSLLDESFYGDSIRGLQSLLPHAEEDR
jgi:hypothetical protein